MTNQTDIIDDLRLLEPGNPWLVAGLIAGILLLALVAFAIRRWRASRAVQPPPAGPGDAALEDALAELERARALIGAGDVRPYGIAVSGIVRRYIEGRFGLVAPRRSTEEFLIEAAASTRLESGHQQALREFLAACDFLKFARALAATRELETLHVAAVKFVSETRLPAPSGPGVTR